MGRKFKKQNDDYSWIIIIIIKTKKNTTFFNVMYKKVFGDVQLYNYDSAN